MNTDKGNKTEGHTQEPARPRKVRIKTVAESGSRPVQRKVQSPKPKAQSPEPGTAASVIMALLIFFAFGSWAQNTTTPAQVRTLGLPVSSDRQLFLNDAYRLFGGMRLITPNTNQIFMRGATNAALNTNYYIRGTSPLWYTNRAGYSLVKRDWTNFAGNFSAAGLMWVITNTSGGIELGTKYDVPLRRFAKFSDAGSQIYTLWDYWPFFNNGDPYDPAGSRQTSTTLVISNSTVSAVNATFTTNSSIAGVGIYTNAARWGCVKADLSENQVGGFAWSITNVSGQCIMGSLADPPIGTGSGVWYTMQAFGSTVPAPAGTFTDYPGLSTNYTVSPKMFLDAHFGDTENLANRVGSSVKYFMYLPSGHQGVLTRITYVNNPQGSTTWFNRTNLTLKVWCDQGDVQGVYTYGLVTSNLPSATPTFIAPMPVLLGDKWRTNGFTSTRNATYISSQINNTNATGGVFSWQLDFLHTFTNGVLVALIDKTDGGPVTSGWLNVRYEEGPLPEPWASWRCRSQFLSTNYTRSQGAQFFSYPNKPGFLIAMLNSTRSTNGFGLFDNVSWEFNSGAKAWTDAGEDLWREGFFGQPWAQTNFNAHAIYSDNIHTTYGLMNYRIGPDGTGSIMEGFRTFDRDIPTWGYLGATGSIQPINSSDHFEVDCLTIFYAP